MDARPARHQRLGRRQRILPYVTVSIVVVFLFRRVLDVMASATGGRDAGHAGGCVVLISVATLGTAAVVSVSGLIAQGIVIRTRCAW